MDTTRTRLMDPETGELLVEYTPGDKSDIPMLAQALVAWKQRMAIAMATKRALEEAIVAAAPEGYRMPGLKVDVEIAIGKDDAKRLVQAGFSQCVSLTESVRYRLLKTECAKMRRLDAERYDALLQLLGGCTRSVRVDTTTDEPVDDEQETQ